MTHHIEPTAISLRPTRRAELPQVVEILCSTVDWYANLVTPEDLASQHDVDLAWANENFKRREFWSAVVDGKVVGVITLQDTGEHLYLGYVYVHKEHVGKRIGRKLLDHAAAEVRRRGLEGMVLIAHPDASWAIRAYQKFGFECVGQTDEEVVSWNDGWLEGYHEEGFQLWQWQPEA